MKLGYRATSSPAWTISGTGAAFLSSVELGSGNPARVTRFQWLSSGSPVITQFVGLRSTFAAVVPGLIAILNLSVPVGTKIEVWGKRALDAGYTYDLGGNSQSQRTVEMWDGTVGCYIACDEGLDPIVSYEVRIYNDVGGVTFATSATTVTVGEIELFESVDLCGKPGYSWEMVDETEHSITLGSQVYSAERRPCRGLNIDVSPTDYASALAEGLANDQDFQRIFWHLSRGNRCMLALRPNGFGTVPDYDALQRETVFGIATKLGPIAHVPNTRRLFTNSYRIREVPGV